MNMPKKIILVVDDEPDIRQLLQEILEDEGYGVEVAENAEVARKQRLEHKPDLILLDIWMPDEDGISLLKDWLKEDGLCPVIMMSGHATVETAVEATRLGAYDFLEKPLSMAKLLVTVERAMETAQLRRENIGLKRRMDVPVEPIGKSLVMEKLRDQVKRLAQHDARVLPARARKPWPATCTPTARVGMVLSSMLASVPSPAVTPPWSSSAASTAKPYSMAFWSKLTAAPCFWMKSLTWSPKPRCA